MSISPFVSPGGNENLDGIIIAASRGMGRVDPNCIVVQYCHGIEEVYMDKDQIQDVISDPVWQQTAFDNIMKTFVLPSIERRQTLGELQPSFPLLAFQVIFFPDDRMPVTRVNEEVQAYVNDVVYKEGVIKNIGDAIKWDEVSKIGNIILTEAERDYGHITAFYIPERGWMGTFDFRKNQMLAEKHLKASLEFYEASLFCLAQNNLRSFIDTVYSACPLAVKSILLDYFSEIRSDANHKAIRSRYNRLSAWADIQPHHRDLYNRLFDLRLTARYLAGEFSLNKSDAQDIRSVVAEIITDAYRRLGLKIELPTVNVKPS